MFDWLKRIRASAKRCASDGHGLAYRLLRARPAYGLAGKFDSARTTEDNRRHWAKADGLSAEAAARARADTEQQLLDELVRLRIQAFEDEHERRMAMIRQEYAERYRQLQAQGASEAALARLQKIRDAKLAAERKRHAEEVAEKERQAREEAARALEARLDREASLRHQIARQEIMNTKEGLAQRKALLELEKKQALAEAETAGERGLVEKLYQLKMQAAEAAGAIADRIATRGTFSARAASLAVRDRTAERNLKANEEVAKHAKRLDERDQRRGELAFA